MVPCSDNFLNSRNWSPSAKFCSWSRFACFNGTINLLAVAIVPLYAWWLLEEKPGLVQLLGIAIVIGTLAMVVSRPTRELTGIS